MNFVKLEHKPTGRTMIIDEKHAVSFLSRKEKDYIEVPLEAPKEVLIEKEEVKAPVTSKKKSKKKAAKKSNSV